MPFFPTTDEEFQYFRSQGYTGSLNDMIYAGLGSLGYTGALSDMIRAYVVSELGDYHGGLKAYRNGTSVFSLFSIYSANNLVPQLISDFSTETYAKDTTATTFSDLITHSRTGNATMVDADGLLKWAPHNLVPYSEDFSNASWAKTRVTATNDYIAMDATNSNTHSVAQVLPTQVIGASYVFEVELRADSVTLAYLFTRNESSSSTQTFIDLTTSTVGTDTSSGATATPTSDGWVLCSVPFDLATADTTTSLVTIYLAEVDGVSTIATAVEGNGFYIRNARYYRSDLGGMVAVPADARATPSATTYVPTTSSAVYLPRRGHHVYNGDTWVNKGLLHESEARTNLVAGSNNFLPANNYWQEYVSSNRVSVTAAQAIGPDGETSMTLLTDGLVAAVPHSITTFYDQPGIATPNNTEFTVSCHLKNLGRRYVTLVGSGEASGSWFAATIDLSDGIVTQTGAGAIGTFSSSYVENLSNGIYRLGVAGQVADSASRTAMWVHLSDTPTPTYGGYGQSSHDGADLGVYIYGAQLEAGSTPSSYIPTAGATATRAAETLTVPIANMDYSATAMSFQMDGFMTYADTGAASVLTFFDWQLNASNRIFNDLDTDGASTGEFNANQVALGVTDRSFGPESTYTPGINVPFSIASRHGSTFINGAVDGTALTADLTPVALPDLSATDLSLAPTFNGYISKFLMWGDTTGDIGDAGIAEAST